jgi:glycogen debranching enzyme
VALQNARNLSEILRSDNPLKVHPGEQRVPFKFNLGPPDITINDGWIVFVTELDGSAAPLSQKGLYLSDTRMISEWGAYLNGQNWDLRSSGKLNHSAARFFFVNQEFRSETGLVESNTLELVISRYLAQGMHEDLDITNYGKEPVQFRLQIVISSDFVDLLNLKLREIMQRGQIGSAWSQEKQQLRTTYEGVGNDSYGTFNRELIVELDRSSTEAVYTHGRITFEISLSPGKVWHTCLLYTFGEDERYLNPSADCLSCFGKLKQAKQSEIWRSKLPNVQTDNKEFRDQFDQALCDAMALRLPWPSGAGNLFFPAAGIPWFVTLFGRDSLIASMQFLMVDADFARGTLEILGSKQGNIQEDLHDEQPGRILHELRFGELSHSKSSLFTPYFGTADASILYPIALHATWMATGDLGLLTRHLDSAERCLEWIDKYGDRDGDGLQEYHTNSPRGYENLGWKDSPNAVLHPDGTPVKGPKALCELQGYVYDAWLRMAEIYDYIGQQQRAKALRQKASALRYKFDEQFWDEEIGCYAYALDGEKRKVLTLTSNVGHCLWSGIVPTYRAERVVKRLMEPDMSTGWGIRTCSAYHLAFNPYSYHNGSVWPHDNSIVTAGFIRYGFIEEALKIVHDVCDAATHFQSNQLPEFYAGVQRSAVTQSNLTNDAYYIEPIKRPHAHTSEFPVQCAQASVPQAWAAGSTVYFLQTLLGIEPDAPHGRLYLDPHLPPWLPELALENLNLGGATFTIRFRRVGFETLHEVCGDSLEIKRGRLERLTDF